KQYGDFLMIVAFMDLMARWGVDPDPGGYQKMMAGCMAEGPGIPIEQVIRIRYAFQPQRETLDLSNLPVDDEALIFIPETVTKLSLKNSLVTDSGIPHIKTLTALKRLNLAGTRISDVGLVALEGLKNLEWICVHRTQVTDEGVARLKTAH